jgi:hypothetical protein
MKHLVKLFILAATVSTLFTSCLKDTVPNDYTHIEPVIINPVANWPKNTATNPTALSVADVTDTVNLYARVSWEKSLSQPVTVTFVRDDAVITAYNTQFGTTYIPVPDAAITATTLQVTIASNTNDAFIPVIIKLAQLDPTKKYMLSYTISDAAGQNLAANYKTYLFPFTLTN